MVKSTARAILAATFALVSLSAGSTLARAADPPYRIAFSTYLGGQSSDGATSVAIDPQGIVYVAGKAGEGFPTTPDALSRHERGIGDAFLTKIDPSRGRIVYSTLLGGSNYESTQRLALGPDGDIYLAGYTASGDYPTTTGAYQKQKRRKDDVFVTRLAPDGRRVVWSTYVGGNQNDSGFGYLGLAVDSEGNAYVAGRTESSDFPTTSGAFLPDWPYSNLGPETGFFFKLDSSGSKLLYSTYLGGGDGAQSLAVDRNGNAYVGGVTHRSGVKTTQGTLSPKYNGGANDGYVLKIDPRRSGAASLVWGTYLGGKGADGASAITVDDRGASTVSGDTNSSDFPTTRGAFQGAADSRGRDLYVTRLSSDGSEVEASTAISGSAGDEKGLSVVIDSQGIAIAGGHSYSSDTPTRRAFQPRLQGAQDAFVAAVNPTATDLIFASYLGGSKPRESAVYEGADDIALTPSGDVVVVGGTGSTDFPATGLQRSSGGGEDGFLTIVTRRVAEKPAAGASPSATVAPTLSAPATSAPSLTPTPTPDRTGSRVGFVAGAAVGAVALAALAFALWRRARAR